MAVMMVMTIFNAHCPSKKHRAWGNVVNRSYSDYKLVATGSEIRKRLGNRNALIQHFFTTKHYEISLIVKKKIGLDDKVIAKVSMDENEYKKYENDNKALLKLLEMAEIFQ
jgi:hypothetical protein